MNGVRVNFLEAYQGGVVMKVMMLTFLCLFVSFMGLHTNDVHAKPKSYPLMCRGGSGMKAVLRERGMLIFFQGGKQGAQVRPPGVGECTWLDRGFRPGEPQELGWVAKDPISQLNVMFAPPNKIITMEIHGTPKEVANYKYLYNKIRNGEVFQVHAFLDTCGKGKKCSWLTVTRVGP